jgi:hypothetical protein
VSECPIESRPVEGRVTSSSETPPLLHLITLTNLGKNSDVIVGPNGTRNQNCDEGQ